MSQITLSYQLPSEIDGEPDEVASRTREQLREVAPEIERLFHQSATQLRNAWQSKALELEPTLDANQLAERWHRSGFSRKVAALTRAGQHVGAAVDTLDSEGQ